MKSKINGNIIIMILVLSGTLLFSLLLSKSSYALKSDNDDEGNDVGLEYIFDPGQYIEYKEEKEDKEKEITNNNLNKQVSETKYSESIIINNKVKKTNVTNNNNTIINNFVEKPNNNSSTDYNFIAVGDWYCNEETKKNNK